MAGPILPDAIDIGTDGVFTETPDTDETVRVGTDGTFFFVGEEISRVVEFTSCIIRSVALTSCIENTVNLVSKIQSTVELTSSIIGEARA